MATRVPSEENAIANCGPVGVDEKSDPEEEKDSSNARCT
jgi:hypothetical protein